MALSATPAVRRVETALKVIVNGYKRDMKDDLRGNGVQISHQMVVLCGTCIFDMI